MKKRSTKKRAKPRPLPHAARDTVNFGVSFMEEPLWHPWKAPLVSSIVRVAARNASWKDREGARWIRWRVGIYPDGTVVTYATN